MVRLRDGRWEYRPHPGADDAGGIGDVGKSRVSPNSDLVARDAGADIVPTRGKGQNAGVEVRAARDSAEIGDLDGAGSGP